MPKTLRCPKEVTVSTTAEPGFQVNFCEYRGVPIVRWTDKGTRFIMLNTHGWKTATVRARMNWCAHRYGLDFKVFAVGDRWMVSQDGKAVEFTEGMCLSRSPVIGDGQSTPCSVVSDRHLTDPSADPAPSGQS